MQKANDEPNNLVFPRFQESQGEPRALDVISSNLETFFYASPVHLNMQIENTFYTANLPPVHLLQDHAESFLCFLFSINM